MSELFVGNQYFDTDKFGAERFVGRVLASDIREGTLAFNQGQAIWWLEIENLSRPMKFNFQKQLTPKTSKNSAWAVVLTAFKNIGVPLNASNLSSLVDRVFWFEQRDIPIGKNKETGEDLMIKNALYPVAVATDQDLASIAVAQAQAQTGADVPPPAETTQEDIEFAVQACATGVTFDELTDKLGVDFADIAGLVTKPFINGMIQTGKLAFDPATRTYSAV